jgi:ribose transport system substrate-binding protein/inositol transport system substrate-binding protein
MKKFTVVLLALALLSATVYGGGRSQGSGGKPVFMLCISHMTNAFTTTVAKSMNEAAKAAGAELIVNEGGNDISRQISQIESGVNQKVNAIIIEPVSVNGVIPAVEAAQKAGIPVIIFNQKISDPSKATTFVGVSNDTLGALEMRRAVQDLGGSGNVALLLGPMGSDGQLGRSKGYAEVIAQNPGVTVVFEETANWTTEEALRLVENWLQTGTTINAIVCQNDGMALGAVKAVEDKGLSERIKVYGLDAVPDALKAVKEGRLEVSVSQATERQSQMAIDIAMKLYRGETVPSENLVEGEIIDKTNVDKHL